MRYYVRDEPSKPELFKAIQSGSNLIIYLQGIVERGIKKSNYNW